MVKEMGLEDEVVEDEDRKMEEEEDKDKGRSSLFNAPQDSRNALGLIKSIV